MSSFTLQQLQDAYKPLLSEVVIPHQAIEDSSHITYRAMVVDLASLILDLNQKDWKSLHIAADVLVLPKADSQTTYLLLKGPTTIFARQIVVENSGSALFFGLAATGWSLTLCAGDIDGRIFLTQSTPLDTPPDDESQPLPFVPITVNSEALCFQTSADKSLQVTTLAAPPAEMLEYGSPAHLTLLCSIIAAWGLMHNDRACTSISTSVDISVRRVLACQLLDWIRISTIQSNINTLALQAISMKVRLAGLNAKYDIVPYLSEDVYKDFTTELAGRVGDFQKEYERFADREKDLNSRLDAADSVIMNHLKNSATSLEKLIDEQKDTVKQLKDSLERSQAGFKVTQTALSEARIAFEKGVDEYKKEQTRKAVIAGAEAVVGITVGIAAIAVGQPEGTAAAAATVGEAAEAAKQTAETVSKLAKITQKLIKVLEQLEHLKESLQQVISAVQATKQATDVSKKNYFQDVNFGYMESDSDTQILDNDYWDIFRLDAEYALDDYRGTIDGASDLQKALIELSIYGKSMYQNYQALVKGMQEMQHLILQSIDNRKDQEALEDYMDRLKSDISIAETMLIIMFSRMLGMKTWLVTEIENQAAAFRYWSLSKEKLPKASIVSDSNTLRDVLIKINGARLNAIRDFKPAPQPGTRPLRYTYDKDPEIIGTLRQQGRACIPIKLSDKQFDKDDRIRVTELKVYVNDEAVQEGKVVSVWIETDGTYADRLHGNDFKFSGDSSYPRFDYRLDGGKRIIQSPAKVDSEFEYYLFKPALFTVWYLFFEGVVREHIQTLDIEFTIQFNAKVQK